MKVIVLYGHSDCGKTKTLKELIHLISKFDKDGKIRYNIDGGDIQQVMSYNGVIVCVCTAGDSSDIIEKNFDYANENHADILVTASRTKGATCDKVIEMANRCPTTPEWYKKSDETYLPDKLQNTCNQEYAKFLLNRINEIINN